MCFFFNVVFLIVVPLQPPWLRCCWMSRAGLYWGPTVPQISLCEREECLRKGARWREVRDAVTEQVRKRK